jgi:hypothetical protein
MNEILNPIEKFNFLIGAWDLKYKVPMSLFSSGDEGEGTGEFKRILNDKYIIFSYSARLKLSANSAKGIFAWDEKSKLYKYWWFEDSGNFLSAACNFINDETLCLNWHDSLLVQTFKKESDDKVVIQMKYPSNENKYEIIMEVNLTRNIKS